MSQVSRCEQPGGRQGGSYLTVGDRVKLLTDLLRQHDAAFIRGQSVRRRQGVHRQNPLDVSKDDQVFLVQKDKGE